MKAPAPQGFAALLARMPRRFKAQAHAVEEKARRRREAQAKRFEQQVRAAPADRESRAAEWQDTVAEFIAR